LPKIIVGTRGSRLALAQTEIVLVELKRLCPGISFEQKTIRTAGDRRPTEAIGKETVGFFTKELEEALLSGAIDVAVHSLKDLPIAVPKGLEIAAVLTRGNPQDVLVTEGGLSLGELRGGSRVGTGSPRRRAQLLHFNRQLEVVPIRGNIETRIGKLRAEGLDGIVLAACGLSRCGLDAAALWPIPFEVMLPAPGQAALAAEVRSADPGVKETVSRIDHLDSRLATTAERTFHASLGGGCQLPLGALATVDGKTLRLQGVLLDPDGRQKLRLTAEGPKEKAREIGESLGKRLMQEGAKELLHAR